MLLPWLTFIVVSLIVYAGFVKLAARLLRYKVAWKSTFFFAVIMLIIVMVVHVLDFRQPAAIRIGQAALLLIGLVILGSWFFSQRGADRSGAVLGWRGGIRLTALAFAMMVVVALAIVIPVQALVR
jgi:hypothetical protein